VVVFDPATIRDNAVYDKPHQLATGVSHVLVNGRLALRDGLPTGASTGRVVRGKGWRGWPTAAAAPPPPPGTPPDEHPELLLLEHPLSPYAQKLKIALVEKSLPFTARTPDAMGSGQSTFGSDNFRLEVPVLYVDGRPLFDSTIILEFIEDRWPEPPLRPADPGPAPAPGPSRTSATPTTRRSPGA
jgi:hypothetical protein